MNLLEGMNIYILVLFAGLFTWLVTSIGASLVFFTKTLNTRTLQLMFGFGSGVMVAASFWSLLNPAIDLSETLGYLPFIFPAIGFIFGVLLIVYLEKKIRKNEKKELKSSKLLLLAMFIHNIPEGLAIGVAFGAYHLGIEGATLGGAVALAIAIGLQNFPEGAAVSVPMYSEGESKKKSFFMGQLSASIEPISALLGVFFIQLIQPLLPLALSIAAGAMMYVVIEELIPEGKSNNKNSKFVVYGFTIGFVIMMILDVSLG